MAMQARVVLKLPARIVGEDNIRVRLENGVYYISDQGGGSVVSTVAGLPSPNGQVGVRRYVTNAVSREFGAAVEGGGNLIAPVWSDGMQWRVG